MSFATLTKQFDAAAQSSSLGFPRLLFASYLFLAISSWQIPRRSFSSVSAIFPSKKLRNILVGCHFSHSIYALDHDDFQMHSLTITPGG
jgi:hypothetical protein